MADGKAEAVDSSYPDAVARLKKLKLKPKLGVKEKRLRRMTSVERSVIEIATQQSADRHSQFAKLSRCGKRSDSLTRACENAQWRMSAIADRVTRSCMG